MRSDRYRVCIGLGTGCATAYHIRRCLWQGEAHFFDWLVTPFPGLITLLRTGLRSLFCEQDAFVPQDTPSRGGFAIRHREMGVISYHDFRPSEGLRDFPQVQEKYAFLAERWDQTIAAGGPILFVRHLIDRNECMILRETLKEVYPDLKFSLLAVTEGRGPRIPWNLDGVCNAIILPTPFDAIARGAAGTEAWKGDVEGWQDALALVGAIKQ
jgi:putative papain-like cysteine peptidase DUF1796